MVAATNLIFFLSDNHTRDLLGAAGHSVVQTPTLDRIAARGVRFANAYAASPLCCPSRAALACGRFPHQTGYWDNAIVYDGRVPSWMHRLRAQGHEVTSIGKLHFRATDDDNGFTEELLPMHILDGKGGTHMLREETHQFGVVIKVGFHAVIPFSQMPDSTGPGLRVFAVTEDDRALEISRQGTD